MTSPAGRVVVAGIGSPYRGDDGVGAAVALAIAACSPVTVDVGPLAEPLDLLGRWDGAELAVVVDATRSGAPPGSVQVLDLVAADPSPVGRHHGDGGPDLGHGAADVAADAAASTHGIGLAGVVRIARAVGTVPRRVVLVGVEGARFEQGEGLSPAVARAVPEAVARVVALVEARR